MISIQIEALANGYLVNCYSYNQSGSDLIIGPCDNNAVRVFARDVEEVDVVVNTFLEDALD